MKKILASFVMSVIMAAVLASSCVAAQSETEVRQALAKTFPGIKVGEIRGSDIPGLYEVEAGSNIIYFWTRKSIPGVESYPWRSRRWIDYRQPVTRALPPLSWRMHHAHVPLHPRHPATAYSLVISGCPSFGDDRIELGQWSRHQQHLAHWTITALLVAAMLLLNRHGHRRRRLRRPGSIMAPIQPVRRPPTAPSPWPWSAPARSRPRPSTPSSARYWAHASPLVSTTPGSASEA